MDFQVNLVVWLVFEINACIVFRMELQAYDIEWVNCLGHTGLKAKVLHQRHAGFRHINNFMYVAN